MRVRAAPPVRWTDRRRAVGLREYLVEDERGADHCDADQERNRCCPALRVHHASKARGTQASCSRCDRERPSIDDEHDTSDAEQDRARCEHPAEHAAETSRRCSLRNGQR